MFELCQKVENCDKRNDSFLCHSKCDTNTSTQTCKFPTFESLFDARSREYFDICSSFKARASVEFFAFDFHKY